MILDCVQRIIKIYLHKPLWMHLFLPYPSTARHYWHSKGMGGCLTFSLNITLSGGTHIGLVTWVPPSQLWHVLEVENHKQWLVWETSVKYLTVLVFRKLTCTLLFENCMPPSEWLSELLIFYSISQWDSSYPKLKGPHSLAGSIYSLLMIDFLLLLLLLLLELENAQVVCPQQIAHIMSPK